MTSNFISTPRVAPVDPILPVAVTHLSAAASISHATEPATNVDPIPASPPLEVQQAIGVAADAYTRLQASGHELRFTVSPDSGKVIVEVRDARRDRRWTAPASKALEVAAGGDL